jgi:NTP pyrophosphatase (non-canonical NTP hydrolase)
MSSVRELQIEAYRLSASKGFHEDEPTEGRALLSLNAERIALMHSELSEALEELRSGRPVNENYYPTAIPWVGYEGLRPLDARRDLAKPEGVPSEMADVVIRVMDFCEANGVDLEKAILEKLDYNATRSYKHGGKKF